MDLLNAGTRRYVLTPANPEKHGDSLYGSA